MVTTRRRQAARAPRRNGNGRNVVSSTPIYNQPSVNTCKFIRFATGTFSTNAAIDTVGSYNFALSYTNNNSEITSLFDQYKIDHVQITFSPVVTQITNSVSPWLPAVLATTVDYDDSTNFLNFTEALEQVTTVLTPITSRVTRKIVPRVAIPAYTGAAFTGFTMAPPGTWCDCANPNIQHYGLKYALPPTGQVQSYLVVIKYHITARQSR